MLLHSDASLLVIDKPAGLPSVAARASHLHDNATARVQAQFADALVVHRLDMATSGLLAFARGKAAQRGLSQAFAARQVQKRYIAVVAGLLDGESGSIDLPLAPDWPQRPRQRVDPEHGKPSLTHWRVLARDRAAGTTRLELEPVTGRSHQLRVHLLAIGHPILGDALYGSAPGPRLLLHACALTLPHPQDGRVMHFASAAPF